MDGNQNVSKIIVDESTTTGIQGLINTTTVTMTPPSEIIEQEDLHLFTEWLDYPNFKFNLLYRGSRDGYNSKAFHTLCDGKSKTLILIKSWEHEKVFGGWVSVEWQDCGAYLEDPEAFIFSVSYKQKFQIKTPDFAIFLGQEYLLCFGSDIMITNNCNEEE